MEEASSATTIIPLTHDHCLRCHARLAAFGDTSRSLTLMDPNGSSVAIQIKACSDACAALIGDSVFLSVGAVFLFDVTIGKLVPFVVAEGRVQNIVMRALESFAKKPLDQEQQSRTNLHLEFFSPNTRVRTKNVYLPLQFNLRARAILDRNNPIYVREFALERGSDVRKQAKLIDFLNKKNKPRFVRFTGIPGAVPDVRHRLRETFRIVLGTKDQEMTRDRRKVYVASMPLPSKATGGGKDREGFFVMEFDKSDLLIALYAMSVPKNEQGMRRGQPETLDGEGNEEKNDDDDDDDDDDEQQAEAPSAPPPPLPTRAPPANPEDVRLAYYYGNAYDDDDNDDDDDHRYGLYDAESISSEEEIGQEMNWRKQDYEQGQDEDELLMVGDRVLFNVKDRVRPLFTWQQMEQGKLTQNVRTGLSFTSAKIVQRLASLEDLNIMRAGLLALISNDVAILQEFGISNIKDRWAKADSGILDYTPKSVVLKSEFYTVPVAVLGRVAQRRIETRRNNQIAIANFRDVEQSLTATPMSSAEKVTDVTTSAWRQQYYQTIMRDSGRLIALLAPNGSEEKRGGSENIGAVYLDDFYTWPSDGSRLLPTAKHARTVGLTLTIGVGRDKKNTKKKRKEKKKELIKIYVRPNMSYEEAVEQSHPERKRTRISVLLADVTPLDSSLNVSSVVALVFAMSQYRERIAIGRGESMERYRWRLIHLLQYKTAPIAFTTPT